MIQSKWKKQFFRYEVDISNIIVFVIFMKWYNSLFATQAFQPAPLPHRDSLGWVNEKYHSKNVGPCGSITTTPIKMEKPDSMSQHEYSAMTKFQRRQLPNPRAGFINVDGCPRLEIRFNQVKFKTPKHGKIHGLPFDSKTRRAPNTEENAIALRNSLINMANKQNIIWYTDGEYQRGTKRGCDSVNLFDPDTNIIPIYEKQSDGTCLFLTTCQLDEAEATHLKNSNGNFLTKTMINQQNAVSISIHDSTNTKNDL